MLKLALCLLLAGSLPAWAWSDEDRTQTADNLASVIGSEEACQLSLDQAAIQSFIDRHVPADDMEFTSELHMSVDWVESYTKDFSASQLTAHCRQVSRVARSYGLIH